MKACSKCGESKPLTDFYKQPRAKDGRFSSCKVCILAERRRRYEVDGETLRERVRHYQASNPERVRESAAKYRESEKGRTTVRRATRRRYLEITYGMTEADYDRMFAQQEGCCAVCRTDDPGRTWTIDHDHTTGAVRGILCWHCNVGLGHFRDDIPNLIAAADYLMRSHATTEGAPA